MRLQNQIAVVTGAGRNIGEDVSKLFALRLTSCEIQRIHQRHARLDHCRKLLKEVEDVIPFDRFVALIGYSSVS